MSAYRGGVSSEPTSSIEERPSFWRSRPMRLGTRLLGVAVLVFILATLRLWGMDLLRNDVSASWEAWGSTALFVACMFGPGVVVAFVLMLRDRGAWK